jgi:hypothetical protein
MEMINEIHLYKNKKVQQHKITTTKTTTVVKISNKEQLKKW